VSRNAGLASSTLTNALNRRWPKGEKLIAEALGIAPEQIWPSRLTGGTPGTLLCPANRSVPHEPIKRIEFY
ncbi:helix-turn-helix domain-containing protein, partial [Salmonella enterica subsp. enterica serovar Anatum]|nr:helix-turn-helix domain-containing protein [Salmonella enterica subsp. enterica serovar Anatum]